MPGWPDDQRSTKTTADLQILTGKAVTNVLLVDEIVPAAQRWRLLSVYINPSTTAIAGNRSFALRVQNDTGLTVALVPSALLLPASSAAQLTWAAGIGAPVTPAGILIECDPIPELYLLAGWKLRVEVTGGVVQIDPSLHAIMYERAA